MGKGLHNEIKFKAAILADSESKEWDEGKAEWELHFVYVDRNERACICEHSPIEQICVIRNRENQKINEVGNVCVKRFLRLFSNKIFAVIKRVTLDINKSLNPDALDLFAKRGAITFAEAEEYKEYWRIRKRLTDDQKDQKLSINNAVLEYVNIETARLISAARAFGIRA